MIGNGELTKLKITSYTDPEQNSKGKVFTAFYNPTSFSAAYGVKYAELAKATPNSKHEMRYAGYEQAAFTIELLFDGTGGSIPSGVKDSDTDVDLKIAEFQNLVYGYDGKIHRPNYLRLEWGETLKDQWVVLYTVTITKDLFDSKGKTLRAKLNCQFKEYSYMELIAAEMEKKSPDMTHVRVVKQGDRLPLMCDGVYEDDRLYLEVARYNGLTDYRNLVPGQKIYFPPLKKNAK
jgi:hypothetical protein